MGALENLSSFTILLNPAWTSACLNGQVCQHSLKTCMLNNALDLIVSICPMLDCFNLSVSQCTPKWYYFCYCSLQLCWGNECCLGQWSYWRYFLTQLQLADLSYLSSLTYWSVLRTFSLLLLAHRRLYRNLGQNSSPRIDQNLVKSLNITYQQLASWQAIQVFIPITKLWVHYYFKLTWITGLEDSKDVWINLGKLRPNALRALCSELTLRWLAL